MTRTDKRPPVDLDALRADYEGGTERGTTAEIARRHHISTRTLQTRVEELGWVRRNQRHLVDRGAIIARMFRVLERQVVLMERDMKQPGEKEVAVLGKLASTLEKLIDIDNAARPDKPAAPRKDIADLRNKLAQRIAQLKDI